MDGMEELEFLSESIPVANLETKTIPAQDSVLSMSKMQPNTMGGVKYKHIGKSGLKISNVGLGSAKLFSSDNPEIAEDIIQLAYENGINFFDISDPYHQDKAELEFGRIFKKRKWPRRQFVICTKIFWNKYEDGSLSRKEIIESVEASLANLQLDYIDLVLINKTDPNCPTEEIARAMTYLINCGKIMYWGTSRWTPAEIYEVIGVAKNLGLICPICEMAEYHWFHRDKVELYMAELYNRTGFGLLTWSPISYGLCYNPKNNDDTHLITKLLLKTHLHHGKHGGHDSSGENQLSLEASTKIKQLANLAEKLGCTINQLAIAWNIRNQTSQNIVISAVSIEQFWDIMQSLTFVSKITHHVNEDLDKILANKPARPTTVSTLQQRWQTTGGLPPC
eukprot:maker-scaffold627_size122700-snap-gene-0.33 protein:Tk10658 transcript:maker-scaffold627_size122700-snap-gene-0.33-mRNA-1 annotation:"voltage-gated potassium channel subunit beta-2"